MERNYILFEYADDEVDKKAACGPFFERLGGIGELKRYMKGKGYDDGIYEAERNEDGTITCAVVEDVCSGIFGVWHTVTDGKFMPAPGKKVVLMSPKGNCGIFRAENIPGQDEDEVMLFLDEGDAIVYSRYMLCGYKWAYFNEQEEENDKTMLAVAYNTSFSSDAENIPAAVKKIGPKKKADMDRICRVIGELTIFEKARDMRIFWYRKGMPVNSLDWDYIKNHVYTLVGKAGE